MIRRAASAVAILCFALIFAGIAFHYVPQTALRPLAESYVRLVPQDLNAPNVITGILLTYRAFDTLGEVAVLFMVAAGVGLLLPDGVGRPPVGSSLRPASEIERSAAQVLAPLIAIFAAYIIMNGHISAGGGFQGGAVIASAVLLLLMASPTRSLPIAAFSLIESLAGVGLVVTGIVGMLFAGGFLDGRFLPLGQFGAFFSAGAIPILSILLGVKVGCELSVILDRFRP